MSAEILADRFRLVLLPLLSRSRLVEGTGPLARISVASGVSRDRLWKLSRAMVSVREEEADRIAGAAAPILGIEAERLLVLLRDGDDGVTAWLRERAPLPSQCVHCGCLGGWQSPLRPGFAVHEACRPTLEDEAQGRWLVLVDGCIDRAPGLFLRAWRGEREGGGPLNLFSVSTRAGMEFRCFRRAWLLSRLPRRPVVRERPEPLTRKARQAWTALVERQLGAAPEPMQALWHRARAAGVRLNLEQLADFARVPHWQFRRSWVEAGLPTPKQVLADVREAGC